MGFAIDRAQSPRQTGSWFRSERRHHHRRRATLTSLLMSAPASSSICTMASSPRTHAYIRGVIPWETNGEKECNGHNKTRTYCIYMKNIKMIYEYNAAIFLSTHIIHKSTTRQMFSTWSSMLLTPSGPSRSMAWPMRSVRPQFSIRKPKSRWNLSVAALESRRLKELKQHSGLMEDRNTKKEWDNTLWEVSLRRHRSDRWNTASYESFTPTLWLMHTLTFASEGFL